MNVSKNTILVVEDDPNTQFLIKNIIDTADLDVSVKVVNNGAEAVDYLIGKDSYADREAHPLPVLIITDLNMPRLSGIELLIWLKQQPKLKDSPVVIMSGSTSKAQLLQAKDLGAAACFFKTSSFNDLIYLIKVLLPWRMRSW